MLQLEQVGVQFGERRILNNLSLEVKPGDFVVVTGHNGAGKSTLFDVITGRLMPQSGTVSLSGLDLTLLNEMQRASYIGRLQQNVNSGVVLSMTVTENLALATYKGRSISLRRGLSNFPVHVVDQILKPLNLGLEKLLDTPIGRLSGGQRQIIAFVMAILAKPRLLLLDEPTAALDPKSAAILMDFACDYIEKHQLPTLLITHDTDLKERIYRKNLHVIDLNLEGRAPD